MAKNMTRGQVQDLLSKFAAEGSANREALINDPKAVIEQLGASLGDREVKAVVETADVRGQVDAFRQLQIAPNGGLRMIRR